MKWIVFEVRQMAQEENGEETVLAKKLPHSEAALAVAQREAFEGRYTVVDDGLQEAPSQLDAIEAQVAYTAMMTDTLLEG